MAVPVIVKDEPLKIDAAALSICGQRRYVNEDAVYEYTTSTDTGSNIGLYVVCDGMGGHEVGDVASRMTVQTILAQLGPVFSTYETPAEMEHTLPNFYTIHQWIEQAVDKANSNIQHYVEETLPAHSKSGTTLTLAFVYGRSVIVANVGDSRTYAWRAGQLLQLTEDHSLAAELAANGVLPPENQRTHPWSHIISRAIGSDKEVEVDFFTWYMKPGDKLLLCSDGLWQAFPNNEQLGELLNSKGPAEDICWQIVAEANQRDGSDNISAVVVCTQEQSA